MAKRRNADRRIRRKNIRERDLLDEIGRFCRRIGVAETTFGRLAVNDGKLVGRLRFGSGIRPKTRDRISKFMHDYRGARPAAKSRA